MGEPAQLHSDFRPKALGCTILFGFVLAVTSGLLVFCGWRSLCEADRISRRSTLFVLRQKVVEEARETGQYPLSLGDVVAKGSLGNWVRADELVYVVGGKPYAARANERLFYEKAARRYGLERGWFDIYEETYYFHRGDPGTGLGNDVRSSTPDEPGSRQGGRTEVHALPCIAAYAHAALPVTQAESLASAQGAGGRVLRLVVRKEGIR